LHKLNQNSYDLNSIGIELSKFYNMNILSIIYDTKAKISNLQLNLEAPLTIPTAISLPIYSRDLPVEPKRAFITLGSGITGSVFVIVFLLSRKMWSKLKNLKYSNNN